MRVFVVVPLGCMSSLQTHTQPVPVLAGALREKWRYSAFSGSLGLLLLRNQNYAGSESRARMPALVQVGLDSACFQTQYTKHPSCGLQARVGPARSSLAATAPRGWEPSRNGTPSSDFPLLSLEGGGGGAGGGRATF